MVENNGIQIRWFNDACYEIKLPNGKGILIDPYIDESKFKVLDSAQVEAADYILISHTHFDHVLDIGKLSEKFHSQIYAGQLSGVELARCYDIPGYRMNLCTAGETIQTEDFVLEVFRGKHTNMGDIDLPSRWKDNLKHENLDPKTEMLNMLGSYEYMIYQLTFPSGLKLLVWGGGANRASIRQAEQFKPDISIVQLPRESTDMIAELYAAIGGKEIYPHHHDFFISQGEDGLKIIRETVEKTEKLNPVLRVKEPEKGVWYTFSNQ